MYTCLPENDGRGGKYGGFPAIPGDFQGGYLASYVPLRRRLSAFQLEETICLHLREISGPARNIPVRSITQEAP